MTPCNHLNVKHRRVDIEYRVDHELAGGNASTCSPTEKSYHSQNSQIHCNKGFDMIENLFSTIFGGCCRPGHFPGDQTESGGSKGKQSSRNLFQAETPQRRYRKGMDQLLQPPQIRRLALDDDLDCPPAKDRSGSLSFLYYQEETTSSSL